MHFLLLPRIACAALGAMTLMIGTASAACPADAQAPSVARSYGSGIEFDVLRNDKPVGSAETRFEVDGGETTVTSTMHLAVDFLFFTAYEFDYRSVDRWCGDELVSLEATNDDNGKQATVRAYRDGDATTIEAPTGSSSVAGELVPTNHWFPGVVKQDRVLNTLTGAVDSVAIVREGEEELETGGGTVAATRYRYTGDLADTEVWYDDVGRWVQLRFKGRDGSTITYRLRHAPGRRLEAESGDASDAA